MDERLKTAYEKANEINRILDRNGRSKKRLVPLSDVVSAVEKYKQNCEIKLDTMSFSKALGKKSDSNYGAMLSTTTGKDAVTRAQIIVNSDMSPEMQRFSVVHELGHLVTGVPNFVYETPDDGKATMSAHIYPDITFMDKTQYEKSNYMLAEQIANVFALYVLIPEDIKMQDITNGGMWQLAKNYGVTEDAICSRMMLSGISFQ